MIPSEPQAAPSTPKYRLKFIPEALKEWQALDGSVQGGALVVLVLAIDKREDMAAYRSAVSRLLAM